MLRRSNSTSTASCAPTHTVRSHPRLAPSNTVPERVSMLCMTNEMASYRHRMYVDMFVCLFQIDVIRLRALPRTWRTICWCRCWLRGIAVCSPNQRSPSPQRYRVVCDDQNLLRSHHILVQSKFAPYQYDRERMRRAAAFDRVMHDSAAALHGKGDRQRRERNPMQRPRTTASHWRRCEHASNKPLHQQVFEPSPNIPLRMRR